MYPHLPLAVRGCKMQGTLFWFGVPTTVVRRSMAGTKDKIKTIKTKNDKGSPPKHICTTLRK